MTSRSLRAAFLAAVVAFLVPVASARAAWPSNPSVNVPVALAPGGKGSAFTVPDGAGGAFFGWSDDRNLATTGTDLYLLRLTAAGVVAPGWPATGLQLCNANGSQLLTALLADGAGGVYLAWRDFRAGNGDVYAHHVGAGGALVAGWPTNGLAISTRADQEGSIHAILDGSGGLYVVWTLASTGSTFDDVYAMRLQSNGAPVPIWPANGRALVATTALENTPAPALASDGRLMVAYATDAAGNDDVRLGFFSPTNASVLLDVPVCVASGAQILPVIVSNGAGGALVFWADQRSLPQSCYGSPVLANGSIPSSFPANGALVQSNVGAPDGPVPDDHGGAWMLLSSLATQAIALTHVGSSGFPTFPVSSSLFGLVAGASLIADGRGGVIVGWGAQPAVGFASDLYAARFEFDGAPAAGWEVAGAPVPAIVSDAPGYQSAPAMASDGADGAILAWTDQRANALGEIFAQRVERFGRLGNPEPSITGVQDVAHDQGGRVRVSWSASYLDAGLSPAIAGYRVWRELPASAALQAVREGRARLVRDAGAAVETSALDDGAGGLRAIRITERAGVQYFWEPAGSVPAAGLPGYSLTVATASDSGAGGNPLTAIMVDALADSGPYWSSPPDSGYSVDDLAPATPAPFTGTFASGSGASLFWGANLEADLAGYRLYRGGRPEFVPDPGTLVAQLGSPGYFDAGASPAYYKLSAVDVHGNESAFAFLLPAGALAVDDVAAPREVALAPLAPNPARGRGVTVAFALPRAMHARLAVYDVQGRRVRSLLAGMLDAGNHVRAWDGRDDGGTRVAAAVYLVRLETAERTLTRRMVWMP